MLQVKHIREWSFNTFEDKVNEFLEANTVNIVVKDIKYDVVEVDRKPYYSGIIIYECDSKVEEKSDCEAFIKQLSVAS